jgi:hypothetical protein
MDKGQVQPKSAMAADIVSIGDSWLGYAICKGLLEPIKNAEEHDWFRSMSDRWKVRSETFSFSYDEWLLTHAHNVALPWKMI